MNRRSARNRHRRIVVPPVGEVRVIRHSPDHIERTASFAGIDRSVSPVRLAGSFRRPGRSIVDAIEAIARMPRNKP